MPEIVVLADVFEHEWSQENRRVAAGDGFDEGVDRRRLAFLLPNVGAAAEKGHEFGGQRLALPIGQSGPNSREERDPERLRQLDGSVAQLSRGLQQVHGSHGLSGLQELGLTREQLEEALLRVEGGRLRAGGGGGGIERILLLEGGQ